MSSDQVARDRTLWEGSNTLKNGNLLTLPVANGEILYVEPIYSQRKDQESAFPKLLRVLVFYKGRVGYAPTISQALSQVGIDAKEAQDISIVDSDDSTTSDAEDQATATDPDNTDAETEESEGDGDTATPPANQEEALTAIDEALRGLEDARDGSFEEYGRALDELDRAVEDYQKGQ